MSKASPVGEQIITIDYQVKGTRGKKAVLAQIVGPLAYHQTVGERGFWTVTHRATGRAVYRFIKGATRARKVVDQLAGLRWPSTVKAVEDNQTLKHATILALASVGVKP